jgi:hypothetical protein
MDTYQKFLTHENRDLMVATAADADLILVTNDRSWKVSDHDVISKERWSPVTGRTFAGSVHARHLRGRLVARDRSTCRWADGSVPPGTWNAAGLGGSLYGCWMCFERMVS